MQFSGVGIVSIRNWLIFGYLQNITKEFTMTNSDRYEMIDEAHGEGGFGKIQKRRDNILDRFVAVKLLTLYDDEEARERFKREATTLAKMSHPNIPAIYDVDFLEKEMWIYFEYIEGNNLKDVIGEKTLPSIEQARRWFTHIGFALEHAHKLGIVHRDVKPANIIISPEYRTASLVDFGIALTQDDIDSLTGVGYVVGTAAYMSPEQIAGEKLDGRSDLYSLGLTLYETLSGHLPHAVEYQALSDSNESIPPPVDLLIKKCLVQDKNHRIETASDFILELRETIRTDIPLSNLLTEARLHEIISVLSQLSSDEFHSKPVGQRLLLINRLKDLMRTDKPELVLATARLIELLINLAMFEPEKDYRIVVQSGFEWGFEKKYSDTWQGEQQIRDVLIIATKRANKMAHAVLAGQFLEFVKEKALDTQPGWYIHDLRKITMSLLANPNCGDLAQDIAEFYDKINIITHSS